MQIQCPHCTAKLLLGDPKPGRYRLNCKRCSKPVLVLVGTENPPEVRVGIPKVSSQTAPDSDSRHSATPTKTAPDQTVDQTIAMNSTGRGGPQGEVSQGPPPIPPFADRRSIAVRSPANDPNVTRPEGSIAKRPDQSVAKRSGHSGAQQENEILPAPSRLGGYRIVKMLGRGAMGAVYHAKQISLDRDVALKTIRGRLADNPASLARFTREAYAAAQLSHHNVVQIYDFGEDNGQHYFSMEWIRGGSLGDLVREKGCIDPRMAATYILQAARGLQFAHRSGMVHRDVKPGNLLLSEDGVVKVADLGLVKVPDTVDSQSDGDTLSYDGLQSGTQVTMQGTAVGTPAYMAPEQSADASTVDHRADIYSLGCSLFYLLVGQAPYNGTVVSEVIEQHARAPLPELSALNPRVPESLCKIVAHAMAKRPGDRYASLAEMIGDLQAFLGVESLTGFSPNSDQADKWEAIALEYTKSQVFNRFSEPLFVGFATAALLTTVIVPFVFSWRAILVGPTMFATGCGVAIAMAAVIHRSAIADYLRRWAGTLSWFEITGGVFALLVAVAVSIVSGLWIGAIVGMAIGAAIGLGYHFAITVSAASAGKPALEKARKFARNLRIDGADEDGLRDFLARYAGDGWQALYEALFGYEAMAQMRRRLVSDISFTGPARHRSLRDRLCIALASKARSKRQARDRKKLAKLEQRSLLSQGVNEAEAREQSWQMASIIMETAQSTVKQSRDRYTAAGESEMAEAKRKRIKAMLADARSGQYKRPRDRYAAVKFAFSGFSRLLVGCLLLTIFLFAGQSTGLFNEDTLQNVRSGEFVNSIQDQTHETDALGGSTSLWSLGIAGCLMCVSAFVSGWRMTPFAAVATLVILFGANLGIPAFPPATPWMVAAVIGLIIYLPGIFYGEENTSS